MYDDPTFADSASNSARERDHSHDAPYDPLQDSLPRSSSEQYPDPTRDSQHDTAIHAEGVPDELQGVHGRLLADGSAWRGGLPSTQGIVQRARSETMHDSSGARPGRSPVDRDPGRTRALTAEYSRFGATQPRGAGASTAKPLLTMAGATAALAVVAMLALLFYGFAHSRGGPSTGPQPATGGSPATGNGWQVNAALTFTSGQQVITGAPAISPANPNTVYEATLAPVTLRRTTDAGKNWTTLKAPGDTSNLEDVQIFVSPFDAKSVFLTLTTPEPPSALATCPTLSAYQTNTAQVSTGSVPLGLALPRSGQIPCSLQWHSMDGGQTWQQLTMPVRAALTYVDPGFTPPMARVLLPQGSRLYAAAGCGPLCMGPGDDIVTSADDGTTWTLADRALRSAGANICDFAPSPSGSDVFALTSQQGCDNEALPPLTLWHSADAGAHWTKIGAPPSNLSEGMQVVAQPSGAPLLYIHLPQATPVPHTVQMTNTPTSLQVSADGGKTWKPAPSAGVASGATPVTGPLATLSDGTVVEGMGDTNAPALYGWKLGDAAWHLVAPALKGQVAALLVIPQSGADELIAATVTFPTQYQSKYAVQSYVS